jgi:hypothetical protein
MNKISLTVFLFGGYAAFALTACHGPSSVPATSQSAVPPPGTIAAVATTAPAMLTSPVAGVSNYKLGSRLVAVVRRVNAAPTASAAAALSNRWVHVNRARQIQVYVFVSRFGNVMAQSLVRAGVKIDRGVSSMKVYQVWANPAVLARIVRLPAVTRVSLPAYGFPK